MGEKSQFITVIFVKELIQYVSSIVEDLEKQKKLQFENFDAKSGFSSQATKEGST